MAKKEIIKEKSYAVQAKRKAFFVGGIIIILIVVLIICNWSILEEKIFEKYSSVIYVIITGVAVGSIAYLIWRFIANVVFKVEQAEFLERIQVVQSRIVEQLSIDEFKEIHLANKLNNKVLPEIFQEQGYKCYARRTVDDKIIIIVKNKDGEPVYNRELANILYFDDNFEY